MALRRDRGHDERTFASWSGDGSITIGGRPQRGRLEIADAVIVGAVLACWDFLALLLIGLFTSSGVSLCTPKGCDPDPAYQVHRATVGAVLYALAAVLPLLIAFVRRRGVVVALVVQVLAGLIMYSQASSSVDDAHANLRQICTAPPAPTAHECH